MGSGTVFLATDEMGFSTTGVVNRTAIAAAVGMAMMLVAGAGLIKRGRYLCTGDRRDPVFAAF